MEGISESESGATEGVLRYALCPAAHFLNLVDLEILPRFVKATWSTFPVCVSPHSPSLKAVPWEENKLLLEAAWKFAAPKGII